MCDKQLDKRCFLLYFVRDKDGIFVAQSLFAYLWYWYEPLSNTFTLSISSVMNTTTMIDFSAFPIFPLLLNVEKSFLYNENKKSTTIHVTVSFKRKKNSKTDSVDVCFSTFWMNPVHSRSKNFNQNRKTFTKMNHSLNTKRHGHPDPRDPYSSLE